MINNNNSLLYVEKLFIVTMIANQISTANKRIDTRDITLHI